MAIEYTLLGNPGRDNALLATIDTGQSRTLMLFDCGDGCLQHCSVRDLQSLRYVFFSHFHIDHIAGFDAFLRHNYVREAPLDVFGPATAGDIISRRLQGVTWNLVADAPGEIRVTSIDRSTLTTDAFLTREGFAHAHRVAVQPFIKKIVANDTLTVDAIVLDHGTPSIGYVVRERPRTNVNLEAMQSLGIKPGPWLKLVKDGSTADEQQVVIDGQSRSIGDLRRLLLVESSGASLAYLTDFSLDPATEQAVVDLIAGCDTLVCENNFRNADRELAAASRHLVAEDVARLAASARVKELVIFHISDRYTHAEWLEQLDEIRAGFPAARFPQEWSIRGEEPAQRPG